MKATNVRISVHPDGKWVDVTPPMTLGRISMKHDSFGPLSVSVRFDLDPQVKAVLDRVNGYTDDRRLEWYAYTVAVINATGLGLDTFLMNKSLGDKIKVLVAIDAAFVDGRQVVNVAAEIASSFPREADNEVADGE